MKKFEIIQSYKLALSLYLSENGIYWYEEKAFEFIIKQLESNNLTAVQMLLTHEDYSNPENSIRKLIYNCHAYIDSIQFGFDIIDLKFSQYGWLDLPQNAWTKNRITLFQSNYIDIWAGKNQTFTYGLHYTFGNSGGGGLPSQFTTPFNSFKDARATALDDFENKLTRALESNKTDSSGNYKLDILKQLQRAILIEKAPKQLTLF